ncbi:MAG: hypothetical protein ACRD5D_00040 [Candidatus Polarisedimenticolia bacterium]
MIRHSENPVRLSPAPAACAAILGCLLLSPGGLPGAFGTLWAEDGPAGQAEPEEKEQEAKEPAKGKEKAPPAKPPAPAARPAAPAAAPRKTAPPPLRFTDEDLERFRKPAPLADEEGEAAEDAVPATAPAAPTTPAPAFRRDPSRMQTGGGGTDYRPPKTARAGRIPPPADPLKAFKDRDAMEKFRADQIQTLRARVVDLESRLGYLKSKKEALINPSPLQIGSTRAPDPAAQADPYRPTNPFPEKPGSGKPAISPMFPPIPPAQTEADAEKDKRMKVKDLLADVETEIKAVAEELETAREELVQVELRFGGAVDR